MKIVGTWNHPRFPFRKLKLDYLCFALRENETAVKNNVFVEVGNDTTKMAREISLGLLACHK